MILNGWKKQLARAGMKQNELADAAGVNRGELSRVCQGAALMPLDRLVEVTAILGCKPGDVYGDDEMRVLYQVDAQRKPKKPSTVSVRVRTDVAALVDEAVESGEYASRNEAVNAILLEVLGRPYRVSTL